MLKCLLFLALVAASVVSSRAADVEPRVQSRDRTTVIISIDGFPAWMWEDPTLPTPTLHRLAQEGAMAKRMHVSNPSVTWPNHTTLITGVRPDKHGVLFNGLLLRPAPDQPVTIEPWRNKSELVRVPTLYDAAYKAKFTTAHVDWIPTTNSGTFTWEFPERPNPNGAVEKEMQAAGLLTADDLSDFNRRNPPWRDIQWTKAATYLIRKHKPNLLIFHLLNTDAINHKFGPGNPASQTAYAFADTCVREVMDALVESGLRYRSTVFVVTDHGFKTAQTIIRPNVLLRQQGLLQAAGPTVKSCDAYVLAQGGSAMAYVTDPSKKAELLPKLKEMLSKLEGVDQVVEPSGYAALHLPSPEANQQMGDLFLVAKAGYAFHPGVVGDALLTDVTADAYPGHHGYLNTDPQLDGLFIAWGYGIKPGVVLDEINNVDVAPTAAAVMNVKLPKGDGRVLDEILRPIEPLNKPSAEPKK